MITVTIKPRISTSTNGARLKSALYLLCVALLDCDTAGFDLTARAEDGTLLLNSLGAWTRGRWSLYRAFWEAIAGEKP